MDDRSTGTKSRERRAFAHYLRTGRALFEEPDRSEGVKFNPWHDPRNGQFTFAPGGPKRPSTSRSGHMPRSTRHEAPSPRVSSWASQTIHPPQLEVSPSKDDESSKRNHDGHVIAPIQSSRGRYDEYVAAQIQAGATRIWPVAGKGRPAKRGESGPNGLPYSDGRFSPTGDYRTNKDGQPKPHLGLDLPAPVGAPVLAAGTGIVTHWEAARGYGMIVIIEHNDGTRALYAHLGKRSVRNGELVTVGQPIGRVGMSGNSGDRGSHLHFEISDARFNPFDKRAKLDPVQWIAKGKHQ